MARFCASTTPFLWPLSTLPADCPARLPTTLPIRLRSMVPIVHVDASSAADLRSVQVHRRPRTAAPPPLASHRADSPPIPQSFSPCLSHPPNRYTALPSFTTVTDAPTCRLRNTCRPPVPPPIIVHSPIPIPLSCLLRGAAHSDSPVLRSLLPHCTRRALAAPPANRHQAQRPPTPTPTPVIAHRPSFGQPCQLEIEAAMSKPSNSSRRGVEYTSNSGRGDSGRERVALCRFCASCVRRRWSRRLALALFLRRSQPRLGDAHDALSRSEHASSLSFLILMCSESFQAAIAGPGDSLDSASKTWG
ncbi:hypothetical protein B0H16DRAFT_823612 [Mycena metata]|uniref:Uncharacterized protein n=1 Tax=Mycena metata TaxID=1033252 RepID=A0AAD7IXZ4_9AGAR|nr:hypothetical protein B0H16DRAFT_823612 [Mycena metata]